MSETSRDRVNSGRVRTHEKNSGDAVRRLGTIIQSIFCAQSGASIRLTVWKWSGESRYPGAFLPVLENFCRAFSPRPTDCPWVSEDVRVYKYTKIQGPRFQRNYIIARYRKSDLHGTSFQSSPKINLMLIARLICIQWKCTTPDHRNIAN